MTSGASSDRLAGNAAANHLRSLGGADTLVITWLCGNDRIIDFTNGGDALDLIAWGFTSRQEALEQAQQIGNDTVFDIGNGHRVPLSGVEKDLLWSEILFEDSGWP